MTTHVGGFPAVATPSQSGARDARQEEEDGRASFAGVLAGATHAQAQAQARPVAKAHETEGTSDLDASSDTDDRVDGDESDKTPLASSKAEPTPIVIERSVAALDPVLQEKLSRVIARMRDETGHDVQVGETYRSQSRQDALFAQGRATPGEVVTWTQISKHTQGRAVDLVVDGGAAGSDAYALLRRIATEEGLRTLGSRDPGHLELPTKRATGAKAEVDAPSVASTTNPETPARNLASVARIAQVASTATLARVAETHVAEIHVSRASITAGSDTQGSVTKPADVARVATAATVQRAGVLPSIAKPATAPSSAPTQSVLAQNGANAGSARFGASAENGGQQKDGGERGKSNNSGNNGYGAAFGINKHATTTQFTIPAMATDIGTTAAQRVAHVIAAREDAPARPLSQIVMSVDAGNGTTDRIQLNLRGASLNATIDAGDQRAAHAMAARSSELVRTLTREGMDVESLQVRAAASVAAPAAPDASQRSSDSSTSSRERSAQWQQQEDRRRSEDDRRQQQRDQRRGKES